VSNTSFNSNQILVACGGPVTGGRPSPAPPVTGHRSPLLPHPSRAPQGPRKGGERPCTAGERPCAVSHGSMIPAEGVLPSSPPGVEGSPSRGQGFWPHRRRVVWPHRHFVLYENIRGYRGELDVHGLAAWHQVEVSDVAAYYINFELQHAQRRQQRRREIGWELFEFLTGTHAPFMDEE
jgi:hypothetical protein